MICERYFDNMLVTNCMIVLKSRYTCLCWESPQAQEGVELFQNDDCHTKIEFENENSVCNKKKLCLLTLEPVIIMSLYCIHIRCLT